LQIVETHIDAIIEGCIKADRKAQEQLYRGFYKVMMNICLRYTHNEQDALAILNMGFYKVFKNIKTFDASKATLYTWVRTIVINCCIDHIKFSRKKIVAAELSEAENVFIEPSIIESIQQGALLELIRQLPPASQAVFNLYIMEGYGHKEIGTLLGISEGTSKWHLNDSRKKLQKLIEQSELRS
jgi:RNA polymerase sigma factor (sigma-70 family)